MSNETLIDRVTAHINLHSLVGPDHRLGVATSGGADSVVLLHLLHQLKFNITVLHVNHHLRGDESDADEMFVRALARELQVPFIVEHAQPPQSNIEQEARDLRRSFFQRARQEHGLDRIALGHTRSDQAETVLFRLLRGAGLTGLAGMRPATPDQFIRPLLTCTREEIRGWASANALAWREDSSNLDTSFTRNRLRRDTLPALARYYNPNLEALLAQSADLAQAEEDYWDLQIADVYASLSKQTPLGIQFSIASLSELHLAVRRRLLRHAIRRLRGDLRTVEFDHIESVLRLCHSEQGHDRVIIPGIDALRSFGQLLLSEIGLRARQERDYTLPITLGQECQLPFQAGSLYVNWLNSGDAGNICANFKKEQELNEICDWDGDLLAPSGALPFLSVRNWQPGDGFQRVGHNSTDKIKTLFQTGKVMLWERKHWPVVLAGREIVWARQFGGSANVSATVGSRRILRLVYRQP